MNNAHRSAFPNNKALVDISGNVFEATMEAEFLGGLVRGVARERPDVATALVPLKSAVLGFLVSMLSKSQAAPNRRPVIGVASVPPT